MMKGRKLLIAGAAVILLAAGGVGIAQAVGGDSEEQVTGPQADRAKRAAVQAVGGGRGVDVERGDDGDSAWEVEVRQGDRELEVNLTRDLKRVGAVSEDDAREDERDEGGDDARENERDDDDDARENERDDDTGESERDDDAGENERDEGDDD
jgi:hypothetical protein